MCRFIKGCGNRAEHELERLVVVAHCISLRVSGRGTAKADEPSVPFSEGWNHQARFCGPPDPVPRV